MGVTNPSVTQLYRGYLKDFRQEIDAVVQRTTPYMVSCILSKSLKRNGHSSSIMEKKFPDLSSGYVKRVIDDMKLMRMTKSMTGNDCVFFVKNDGSQEAEYTRGLIAYHIIADVISAGGSDISGVLPSNSSSALKRISVTATSPYKLSCSRYNYLDSMSAHLMEIVTVFLPKNSGRLDTASRANAIAPSSVSRRVTPLLFLGSMMALAGNVQASVTSNPSSQVSTNKGDGNFVGMFSDMVKSDPQTMNQMAQFESKLGLNVANSVTTVTESLQKIMPGFSFNLEPITHNVRRTDGAKFSAYVQNLAERLGNDLKTPMKISNAKGQVLNKLMEFVRNLDPNGDVLVYDDKTRGYSVVFQGDKSDHVLSIDSFLDNTVDEIMSVVETTTSLINDRDSTSRRLQNNAIEAQRLTNMGVGTDSVIKSNMENGKEIDRLQSSGLSVMTPTILSQFQNFFQMFSVLLRTNLSGNMVMYSNPCPSGTTCRTISYVLADPVDADRASLAESVIAAAVSMSPDTKNIRDVEIRAPENLRSTEIEDGSYIHPYSHYQTMKDLEMFGYSRNDRQEMLRTGESQPVIDTMLKEISDYQTMNLNEASDPVMSRSDTDSLVFVVWNSLQNSNPAEIITIKTIQDFFAEVYPKALQIDSLMESAKSFISQYDLDTVYNGGNINTDIRRGIRKNMPSFVRNLMINVLKEQRVTTDKQTLGVLLEEMGGQKDTPLTTFLRSKAAAYIFRETNYTHKILQSIPMMRWVSLLMTNKSDTDEIESILDKMYTVYENGEGSEDFDMTDDEIVSIARVLREANMSHAGRSLGIVEEYLLPIMIYTNVMMFNLYSILEVFIIIALTVSFNNMSAAQAKKLYYLIANTTRTAYLKMKSKF